ncbi:hypothetical protein [Hafnia psychrotolerans]|uniref:Uncharacterized protein n=1 Tax=Hafnia psychrotolerans TaxID=1477018 RepID=A0ABQ1GTB5_9GAMM|nr:hypothetical protein [Hafnia psychrotolerans]GGA49730.1 hypothetical protein GCM10011328_26340 [Hafnia psychrotolerans]
MGVFDWETALNKDDSLYFYPLSHSILGNYKIQFELSGSYDLIVSDAIFKGSPVILFEYIDEDDDRPALLETIESDSTVEAIIEHLNSTESMYHGPIYKTVYEWVLPLFYDL